LNPSRCARYALAVFAVMVALICGCGGTTFNPTPVPSSVFPQQITAGSQSFVLLINGANFQSNSVAQWNGINRPTVYNNDTTQVSVTIFATDIAAPGQGQITVTNPAPGGGVSVTPLSFIINPAAVNGPQITSLSPAYAVAGSNQNLLLAVSGTGFASTDSINWNGTPQTTTTTSSGLSTTITSENLAATALASVSIQTSAANIASPSVQFQIGPSSNAVPTLSSMSPANTKIGSVPANGYILVNGKNFVPASTVLFNGSPRSTGYVSNNQLAVVVQSSDVATGGTIAVTVSNPNPGGGASGALNFSIQ